MPISDVASLVGGAALGAPVSTIFNLLIEEAKKVKDFKPLSEDLASTMERLVPIINDIDSMQRGSSTTGKGELKFLLKTMQRAEQMVRKCSRVRWYNIAEKAWYTREIKGINQDFLRFCQLDLQLIQYFQLLFVRSMPSLSTKIDLSSDTGKDFPETFFFFIVPNPREVDFSWLGRPFRELKKKVLEDVEVTVVVVSAPSACGKTTLVTMLCHDTDVKGKFKHIFFITLSKFPNTRLIVKMLLRRTGCISNEFAIEQLFKQFGPSGPILVVLDDVWPEEEYFVEKFLIQLNDYKIIVTSRFEFPSLGPTFQLEGFINQNIKNLFTECTPQANCLSCANRDHLLQKILKPCNGSPFAIMPPFSICDGCNSVIEDKSLVNVLGVLWHPTCFCCDVCHNPISSQEIENHVSNRRGKFHKSCYREMRNPTCSVCKEKIPSTAEGIKYNKHPFWEEKYCPSHDVDGTLKCFSCERLEPRGTNYVMLGDCRCLCLECMESAVMDTSKVQPLHFEILEFFEGLNMKIEKSFPVNLVDIQAMDKALGKKWIDLQPGEIFRASCHSRDIIQSRKQVSKKPSMESHKQLVDMVSETPTVIECEVTAILILYGLPRLLTGYILAHVMMHAYLRLNGYRKLDNVLEEGICQVLGHMWLESQTYATIDATAASSSHTPAATTSERREFSDFEKKLIEFYKVQINTDETPVVGVGFSKINEMVTNSSLWETLKYIRADRTETKTEDHSQHQNDIRVDREETKTEDHSQHQNGSKLTWAQKGKAKMFE